MCCLFFFNDTATTEIYTLSLHDALPICSSFIVFLFILFLGRSWQSFRCFHLDAQFQPAKACLFGPDDELWLDRKSTRLNSSHANISYAVFCLKKKNNLTKLIIRAMKTNT